MMIRWNEFINGIAEDTKLVSNVMLVFSTIYGKKQGSCIGMIDVHSVGTRLKKQNLGAETICEEGVWILEAYAIPWVMKV